MPPKGHKIAWSQDLTGFVTTAQNVGTGAGKVFRDEAPAGTLNFKSIAAGANITVTNGADDITIAATVPTAAKVPYYITADQMVGVPDYNDGARAWVAAQINRYTFATNGFSCFAAIFPQGVNSQVSYHLPIPPNCINDVMSFIVSTRLYLTCDNADLVNPIIKFTSGAIIPSGGALDFAFGSMAENKLMLGTDNLRFADANGTFSGTFNRGDLLELQFGRCTTYAGLSNDTFPGNIYLIGLYLELKMVLS